MARLPLGPHVLPEGSWVIFDSVRSVWHRSASEPKRNLTLTHMVVGRNVQIRDATP